VLKVTSSEVATIQFLNRVIYCISVYRCPRIDDVAEVLSEMGFAADI